MCFQKLHALVTLIFQALYKCLHITIAPRAHKIMYGKGAAFFKYTERFAQELLPINMSYIVVNVIADNRIESLVGKIKLLLKRNMQILKL